MPFENWLEIIRLVITLIATIAIPIVIFVVGNRITNLRQLEEKLRADRIEIYNKILEPFFLVFSTEAIIQGSMKYPKDKIKTAAQLSAEKTLTLSYQDYAFKLSLIGSDDVVRAFNNLMQVAFSSLEEDDTKKGERLIMHIAILLLEIRKSLGNEATKLHALEMLEWKIKDMRSKYKVNGEYPDMKIY